MERIRAAALPSLSPTTGRCYAAAAAADLVWGASSLLLRVPSFCFAGPCLLISGHWSNDDDDNDDDNSESSGGVLMMMKMMQMMIMRERSLKQKRKERRLLTQGWLQKSGANDAD